MGQDPREDAWTLRLSTAEDRAREGENEEATALLRVLLDEMESANATGFLAYRRALELEIILRPERSAARVSLARLLLADGRHDAAIAELLTARRIDAHDPGILRLLARAFLASGDAPRAAAALLDLVPLFQLAIDRAGLGRDRGVEVHRQLEELGSIAEHGPLLHVGEALTRIATLIRRNPRVPEAHTIEAMLLARAGRADEAAEAYGAAIALLIAVDDQHRPRQVLREALLRMPHPLLLALAPRVVGE